LELIWQLLEIVHTFAAIEALALAQALGLEISSLVHIIGKAAGASKCFTKVSGALGNDSALGDTVQQLRDKLVSIEQVLHDC
jgi:3-hydroxyisobutyrate dehydrogenase